jgi:DNA invertase Pin-like site-specific DNA recombinase
MVTAKRPGFLIRSRLNVRERTRAGLDAARARGRHGGRKLKLDAKKRAMAVDLYQQKKHTVGEICQMVGVSKPTLYKYVETEG